MKLHRIIIYRSQIFTALAACAVIIAILASLAHARQQAGTVADPVYGSSKAAGKTTPHTPLTAGGAGGAAANTPPAVTQNTPTPSPACSILTLAIAQQLAGPAAHASTVENALIAPSSDTTLDSCRYSGSSVLELSVRTPKKQLGTSENATAFGSERPSGATSVSGYGQSAFWNPTAGTFNVLSQNIWYAFQSSTGTQTDSEAIAQAVRGAL